MAKPASKKTASTAVATRPAGKNALVSMQEQVKKDLEALKDRVGSPGGDAILVGQDKQFKLPDGSKHPGPLDSVIVDFVTGRFFYDRVFDPKNPCPPACFAIAASPKGMAPDKSSPVKQSDKCDTCPMNEFGSAGDGKACKEMRVLAVIPEDADAETTPSVLKVSPTALKAFDSYVSTVGSTMGRMTYQVVTQIGFDPKLDYPSLRFGNPKPADDDLALVAFNLREAARQRIMAGPDVSQYTPPGRKASPAKRK